MLIKQILKDWGLEALILFLFVLIILPFGPGITYDSVSFFEAGNNLFSQGRYVHSGPEGDLVFAAHRFPLYPVLLRMFNVAPVFLMVFQIGLFLGLILAIRYYCKRFDAPKYFMLLLVTVPIIMCYYCLWTESLYGVLLFILFILLKKEEDFNPITLILIVVSLLCLTRLVGIIVVGSLFLAYLLDKRVARGFAVLGVGVSITVIWILLGSFLLGESARQLSNHMVSGNDILALFAEFGKWIIPFAKNQVASIFGLIIFSIPLLFGIKEWQRRLERGVLFWFLIIHFYAYVIFIIVAKSFIDASIAFGFRTLFPLILTFIGLLILLQKDSVLSEKSKDKMRYLLPKFALLVVGFNALNLIQLRQTGIGYNSADWRSFEFTEVLEHQHAEVTYTNDKAAVYLFAHDVLKRPLLPEKKNLYTQLENATYEAEIDLMLNDLSENPDYRIIWIRNGITGDVYPSYEELKEHPELEIVYDDWLCLILKSK